MSHQRPGTSADAFLTELRAAMERHLDVDDPVTMAVYNALPVPTQRLCFEDMLQRYAYVPDVRVEVRPPGDE